MLRFLRRASASLASLEFHLPGGDPPGITLSAEILPASDSLSTRRRFPEASPLLPLRSREASKLSPLVVILIVILLISLFGGGYGYRRGNNAMAGGGGILGLILIVLIILFLMGHIQI